MWRLFKDFLMAPSGHRRMAPIETNTSTDVKDS
jgi:hypothetical protein